MWPVLGLTVGSCCCYLFPSSSSSGLELPRRLYNLTSHSAEEGTPMEQSLIMVTQLPGVLPPCKPALHFLQRSPSVSCKLVRNSLFLLLLGEVSGLLTECSSSWLRGACPVGCWEMWPEAPSGMSWSCVSRGLRSLPSAPCRTQPGSTAAHLGLTRWPC